MPENPDFADKPTASQLASANDEVDWTTDSEAAVPSVKDQGACGSCWAFACADVVETRWNQRHSTKVDVSEQQLCDCDRSTINPFLGNMGCKGGRTFDCFRWFYKTVDGVQNSGATEEEYPYISGDGSDKLECQSRQGGQKVQTTGYKIIPQDDLDALLAAIGEGPVAISVQANQPAFKNYAGGLIDGECGDSRLDHAVVAIGKSPEPRCESGMKIKVRNSWGGRFGEAGYMWICPDQCGVTKLATYPKMD